jgi:hypothetical protein
LASRPTRIISFGIARPNSCCEEAKRRRRPARYSVRAGRIRDLVDVARGRIIEVGRELIAARAEISHGQWLGWLDREFRWSHDAATNYMRVAQAFQIPNGSEFPAFNIEAPISHFCRSLRDQQ